jgi:predicted ATP-grasp superfamily ATP-dependent carboligase
MDLNGLGVLRSLALEHVNCIAVDETKSACGMRSKFGTKKIFSALSGPRLVDALIDLGKAHAKPPVLFITQEATLQTISENRDALQPYFAFRLPVHDRLMALMDKDRFHSLAACHAAPLPASITLGSLKDLSRLDTLRFPCILKPAYKSYAYGNRFKKGYIVNNWMEVKRLYVEIAPVQSHMVVQEWIDGEDSDIYFCLQFRPEARHTAASFVGRKLRSWPPRVGGTASCTVAEDYVDEAIMETDRFFKATGFFGMGGIEYKVDRRTGRLMMIEPTVGRTDFQHEVAVLNGVNLPYFQYCAEAGLPAPILTQKAPAVWREPVSDLWSKQVGGTRNASADCKLIDSYWRWSDPGPALSVEQLTSRAKAVLGDWLSKRK